MQPSTQYLNTSRWSLWLLVVSLLLVVWTLKSYLWDPYQVVTDTQNFYWMARAQDPTLFATDYIYLSSNALLEINMGEFQLILHRRSPGYGLLFYLAGTILDYVWLTKLSIWLLVSLSVIYLFKTGRFLRDNLTGASLSLIFVFLFWLHRFPRLFSAVCSGPLPFRFLLYFCVI